LINSGLQEGLEVYWFGSNRGLIKLRVNDRITEIANIQKQRELKGIIELTEGSLIAIDPS
jgi:hypothetical protein